MAKIRYSRVLESALNTVPIIDGNLTYTTDSARAFIDVGTVRKEVTNLFIVENSAALPAQPVEGKPYFVIAEKTFKIYNGATSEWETATANSVADGVDYDNTDSGLTATTVQDAIDEIVEGWDALQTEIDTKIAKVPTATEDNISVFTDDGQVKDGGKSLSDIADDINTAVSNRLIRADIIAGTNVILTNGIGNKVTLSVPSIPLPDKFASSEEGQGIIGAVNTYDSTALTLISGIDELSEGDVVIFVNGYQAEVATVDAENDEYTAVTISVPQTIAWGGVGGQLSNQTDLVNEFAKKVNIDQGAVNEGKILIVDNTGKLVIDDLPDTGVLDVTTTNGGTAVNTNGIVNINLADKVNVAQGAENVSKYMRVGASGNLSPRTIAANEVSFVGTSAGISSTEVQAAILEAVGMLEWVDY